MKAVFVLCLLFVGYVTAEDKDIIDTAENAYQFSYSTGTQGPAQIFREEKRSPDGSVVGKYGYVDPNGQLRVVEYRAGPQGFSASGDTGPDHETLRIANQIQEQDKQDKAQHIRDQRAHVASGQWNPAPIAPIAPTWNSQQAPIAPNWNSAPKQQQSWDEPAQPSWNSAPQQNWDTPKRSWNAPPSGPQTNWNTFSAIPAWAQQHQQSQRQAAPAPAGMSAWPQLPMPSGSNPLQAGPYTFFMINHDGQKQYSYSY